MRVFLINPRSGFLEQPAFVPPLGLLYLGAALEAAGHETEIADLNLDGVGIGGRSPELIGVSCVTANFQETKQIIANCRSMYPGVPVAVGGPHLSVRPGDGQKLGADWFGCGDGENKICYLASTLARGFSVPLGFLPDWADVDVDRIPIPARHLVPVHDYVCTVDGEPATSLLTSRGCPFACAFCCRWEGSRRVRARAIGNVMDEVGLLCDMGFRALAFHDDEFNLLDDRLLEICRQVESMRIRFKANARADLLTYEQAEALARAGCSWLCVGVESGNAGILKACAKGTTPEINSRARQICRDVGLKFKAYVIVGLPGETHETVEETHRWLIANEVDDLTVTMFVGFPGSAIYDHPGRYDVECSRDYEHTPLTFRGMAGLELPRVTRTSGLDCDELAQLPEKLEARVRRELGLVGTYQERAVA